MTAENIGHPFLRTCRYQRRYPLLQTPSSPPRPVVGHAIRLLSSSFKAGSPLVILPIHHWGKRAGGGRSDPDAAAHPARSESFKRGRRGGDRRSFPPLRSRG